MSRKRNVEIKSEGLVSFIIIDGLDISNMVQGVTLDIRAREIPVVTIRSTPDAVTYSGPAEVKGIKGIKGLRRLFGQ